MARKEDNLIPFTSDQNREEAKKNGRKGGIASGEARRNKKLMRETLEMCLEMKNKKGVSYRELATIGLINGAIKGNAQNYKVILETLGELNANEDESTNNGIIVDLVEALNNAKKN